MNEVSVAGTVEKFLYSGKQHQHPVVDLFIYTIVQHCVTEDEFLITQLHIGLADLPVSIIQYALVNCLLIVEVTKAPKKFIEIMAIIPVGGVLIQVHAVAVCVATNGPDHYVTDAPFSC